MTVRVAILTDPLDQRIGALSGALTACSAKIEVRVLHPAQDDRHSSTAPTSAPARTSRLEEMPFGSLLGLLAYRPHLVICKDFGRSALQAAVFRSLSRRSRLLLCATEAPRKLGVLERRILRRADGVLAEGDAIAQAVEQFRFPSSRIFPTTISADLEPFLACSRTRSPAEAHRLVFAGDLSPQSGAADLLIAVATWAEQHPSREIDLWWVGEGDLAGVLDAQPLPHGVTQKFLGRLEPQAMAATFAQCGLLVVPSLVDDRRAPVLEALAAGLPVLGSRVDRKVRRLIRDEVNGWLFNPLQPEDMAQALSRALDSPLGTLEQMRDHAQALVRPTTTPGVAERFARAFASVVPDLIPEILARRAP